MTAAPSLWRADGKPGRRLPALSLALDLRSGEVSTARLRLPAGEWLSVREWVRLAAPNGETGVYRVRRTETDYAAGIQTAELEHGLAVLEDTLLPDEDIPLDGSAEEVLSGLLARQDEALWALGTVELGERITLEAGGDSILDGITRALAEYPDTRLALDQDALPWRLSVVKLAEKPEAEGRLDRNLAGAKVSYDAARIRTRAVSGNLPGGGLTGEAAARWGVICGALSIPDDAEEGSALASARLYLENRSEPAVSVTLEAADLSRLTGEAQDSFRLGEIMRLALPEYGAVVTQQITGLCYEDAFGRPDRVRVTLANRPESLFLNLRRVEARLRRAEGRGRRTGRRSRRNTAKLAQQEGVLTDARLTIDKLNAQIALTASREEVTDIRERMSRAGITVDGAAAEVKLLAAKEETDRLSGRVDAAESRITVNADAIGTKVSRDGVISSINQTAESIRISASKINLDGYVTVSDLAATISDLGYVDISQAAITQLTVSEYLRYDGHNAKWKSKEVVTGASGSALSNVAIADADNNVVSRVKLSYVKPGNLQTDTIYYLGY